MSSLKRLRRPRLAAATLAVLATAVVAVVGPSSLASASSSPAVKPTIVLVHGAWADSSSWSKVIPILEREHFTVLAEPNPLRSLSGDAAYLTAFIRQHTSGPVVLVGHSYGGAVMTDAAMSLPTVKRLVYVDAFAPDQGETVLGLQASVPGTPDASTLFDPVVYPGAPAGDADLYLKTDAYVHAFASDISPGVAAAMVPTQRPVTLHALTEPSTAPAWKSIPSWYVLGTQDQIIAPSLELMMANRAHSHIVRVDSGHLSLVTHPRVVAGVITAAALTAAAHS